MGCVELPRKWLKGDYLEQIWDLFGFTRAFSQPLEGVILRLWDGEPVALTGLAAMRCLGEQRQEQPQIPIRLRSGQAFDSLRSLWMTLLRVGGLFDARLIAS